MSVRLLAVVCLLAPAGLTLAACGEVAQCEVGTPGCLSGPPLDGRCKADLVLTHGTCAEPGASAPPLTCGCEDGEICTLDSYRCVDYCEPLDVDIGSGIAPPALTCGATSSFDELCRSRCLLECRQWQAYCAEDAGCSEEACASEDVLAACEGVCGEEDSPALCMAQLCGDTRALACREVRCPGAEAPRCDDLTCRNSCAGYNFDGVCDDGDLVSAASGVCAFGSDCADCGPRRGEPALPQPQGGPCAFHSGCLGANVGDIALAAAWCIEVDANLVISRCAPDCTDAEETCPAGSACFVLSGVDQDGDGEPDPIRQGDRVASACFPVACR